MPSSAPILPRAVLFDLDGTLIDHFDTLFRCYEHAFTTLGLPVPAPQIVRRTVGGSMEVTMRKLIPEEHVAAAAKLWREHIARTYLDDVHLMPGALELVKALHVRGVRLGVFTNKIGEHARGICRHLGLERWLDVVLGADDTAWRKPQPEFTHAALERIGTEATSTLLIGDSPYDIQAAHAVGMQAPCVTTGTHDHGELQAAGADGIFASLSALARHRFGLHLETA